MHQVRRLKASFRIDLIADIQINQRADTKAQWSIVLEQVWVVVKEAITPQQELQRAREILNFLYLPHPTVPQKVYLYSYKVQIILKLQNKANSRQDIPIPVI